MSKKSRNRKTVIYIAQEGHREENFLNFLQELFDPEKRLTLKFSQEKGGTSNAILDRAIKKPFYKKIYAWFDEDDKLDNEHRRKLEICWGVKLENTVKDADIQKMNIKNKNPIVIVSTPYSAEGILIRLFNKKIPKLISPVNSDDDFEENKKRMKSAVKGFMGKTSDIEFYRKNLTKEYIIKKAEEIEELRLLLTIFDIN